MLNEDRLKSSIPDICTHIAPTIHCGPADLNLNKPAVLKIPHCAENLEHWRISLYYTNAHIQDPEPKWRKVVTLGEETINTPTYVQIDEKFVCIMTEFLGRFALVGESIAGPTQGVRAVKRLKLFLFGPSVQPIADCNIRVYVVEDLPSSKEHCTTLEAKLGGIFLGQSSPLTYCDNGQDLHLTIACAGGWKPKAGTESQKIPFSHVWNNWQALHCAFAIEHNDHDDAVTVNSSALKFEVSARQRAGGGEVSVTHIASFLPIEITAGHTGDEYSDGSVRSVTVSDKGVNTCVQTDSTESQIFKLSRHTKRDLCNCLDPPTNRGNDWRMLAQRLNCDRYIAYFATKPSPTEHILDLWECRNRDACAINDLSLVLRNMSRLDAVEILEKCVSPSWL